MKIHLILFLLSVLGPVAQASTGANGGEAIFLYYIYQMEYLTYEGQTVIAPTCKSGTANTPCTFLKFLRNTIFQGGKPTHLDDFNRGFNMLTADQRASLDTISPDLLTVEKFLHTTFWQAYSKKLKKMVDVHWFKGVYDGARLLNGMDKGVFSDFVPVLTEVTNALQETRAKRAADGLDPLDSQFGKVKEAVLFAQDNRLADQMPLMIEDMSKPTLTIASLTAPFEPSDAKELSGIVVKTEPKTLAQGRTYDDLDLPRTIEASGITPGDDRAKLLFQWINQYSAVTDPKNQQKQSDLSIGQKHQRMIDHYQTVVSAIEGPSTCLIKNPADKPKV
ncbi:hypothetical protein N431DRAFT_463676 [Stipitochalara longipes BDJ]|nr:hypothetical protein N431DRAFT_463676 [Stipitochalara longipes BDJ]